jgi:hypothetical protein
MLRSKLVLALTGVAVMVSGVALPATSASADSGAISRVECDNRADFLNLVSTSTTCWANAGQAEVRLYSVDHIDTGNNDVRLRFSNGVEKEYGRWTSTAISCNGEHGSDGNEMVAVSCIQTPECNSPLCESVIDNHLLSDQELKDRVVSPEIDYIWIS